jgi:hypothetical protein
MNQMAQPKPAQNTLVMKFGGTSVGTHAAMAQAIEIVRATSADWPRLVVVTSALSGVTNLLLDSAAAAARGELAALPGAEQTVRQMHHAIAARLVANAGACQRVQAEMDTLIHDFGSLCRAIGVLGEASPRALDAVAALGERLCVRLLAAALQAAGVRAEPVEATRLIVTDDQFQSALPDLAATTRHAAGRHHHVGARRQRLYGRPVRRRLARRRRLDLDGCGWGDERRPAHRACRAHHPGADLPRDQRAGLLWRQGAASQSHSPGDRRRHLAAGVQHLQSVPPGHAPDL